MLCLTQSKIPILLSSVGETCSGLPAGGSGKHTAIKRNMNGVINRQTLLKNLIQSAKDLHYDKDSLPAGQ